MTRRKEKIFFFLILAVVLLSLIVLLSPEENLDISRVAIRLSGEKEQEIEDYFSSFSEVFLKVINSPLLGVFFRKEPVYSKGIFLTSWTAGNSSRMEEIFSLIKRTELNSVVIDVKDFSGRIAFDTDTPLINEIGSERIRIQDIDSLIKKLKRENIYTIARVVVFEDKYLPLIKPELALKFPGGSLWQDYGGNYWLDPASKEVWDYHVAVAKEAIQRGFDEINFDYVRFPSDGNISSIVYPFWDGESSKSEVIKSFFEYLNNELHPLGAYLSVDLFGLTLTAEDDLNIGQYLEDAVPYFDYICPMVYPSHYFRGFEEFSNPALHPYEVIYRSLVRGKERIGEASTELRPWLQDFDMGAVYDAEMIKLEKKAVYDADAFGWLLWNPGNRYTEDALEH